MKLAHAYESQGAEPIANNYVRKGGDINSSMQSNDRSHIQIGADYDSNASASYIAINDARGTAIPELGVNDSMEKFEVEHNQESAL